MKITDLINIEAIDLNVKAFSKEDVIKKAINLMTKNGNIVDLNEYEKLVFNREQEGTTGIGEEIAIPHGKGNCVSKPGVSAMVIPDGVNFDSLDEKDVKLLFLIAAPDTKDNVHLNVLSKLSSLLMNENFRNKLLNAKSKEEFLKIIDDTESMQEKSKKEE